MVGHGAQMMGLPFSPEGSACIVGLTGNNGAIESSGITSALRVIRPVTSRLPGYPSLNRAHIGEVSYTKGGE